MPQGAACVMIPGAPMLFHAEPREFVVLGMALVVLCPIDQMDDVVDLALSDGSEQLCFRAVLEFHGQFFQQTRQRVPKFLDVLELVGAGAGTARIADLLLPCHDVKNVAGKLAACAPKVDLEGERVMPRLGLDYPLQRRVRNQPAVPVVLAFDLDGGKARRQRAARQDVLWPDRMCRVIKVSEVAAANVHGADAKACPVGIVRSKSTSRSSVRFSSPVS